MIKPFADRNSLAYWERGKGHPTNLRSVVRRKLAMLDAAKELDDLKVLPGNKLHPLRGDRAYQHAIWLNTKYRSSSHGRAAMHTTLKSPIITSEAP